MKRLSLLVLAFVLVFTSIASALTNLTVTSPVSGSVVSGIITLAATEIDGDAKNLTFYYGSGSCANFTSNLTAYTCNLDTTTLPDGVYTFYANATNNSGFKLSSPLVTNVSIDNAPNTGLIKWMDGASDLNSLTLTLERGLTKDKVVRLKNVGAANISVTLSHSLNLQDSDEHNITLDFSTKNLMLNVGETKDVTLTFEADEEQELGAYSGLITAVDSLNSSKISSFSLELKVKPALCDDGIVGDDLDITINNPDNNDNFNPGETINSEIKVENNANDDLDVRVEAYLYDELDSIVSAKSDIINIDEDDDETFDLELQIPADRKKIEEGSYKLYVIAYDADAEDENCAMDENSIDIELENEDIYINKAEFSSEEASCGETTTIDVEITNIGKKNLDDVALTIKNSELNTSEETEEFELEKFSSKDNIAIKTFDIKIPAKAKASTYDFKLQAKYDGESETTTAKLKINCNEKKSVSTAKEEGDVKITLANEIKLGLNEKSLIIPVTIENTGIGKKEFEVEAKGLDSWGEITLIEQPQALNTGDKSHAYIYIKLKEGITGPHDLTINVKSEGVELKSSIITVNAETDQSSQGISSGAVITQIGAESKTLVSTLIKDKSDFFWVVGDILLLFVAIFLLKLLFRRD
ncbi:putative S-layer protein [Candidatus Woesearchaeota archaeon]|nr:putative S-layer protein [Candidatus Woesearchaeota archaeon]